MRTDPSDHDEAEEVKIPAPNCRHCNGTGRESQYVDGHLMGWLDCPCEATDQ